MIINVYHLSLAENATLPMPELWSFGNTTRAQSEIPECHHGRNRVGEKREEKIGETRGERKRAPRCTREKS